MDATELYRNGNLSEAIGQLVRDAKGFPRDLRSRTFLFELLCFQGSFDGAERQLDVIAEISNDATSAIGIHVYRNLIAAENARREFFKFGRTQPGFLIEPPVYTELHLRAATCLAENPVDQFEGLLEQAAGIRPAVAGAIDGNSFSDLRDSDDLLAPFIEV